MLYRFVPRALLLGSLTLSCAGKGVYIDAPNYVAAHPPAAPKPEKIRPGDTLNVRVFNEPALSMEGALVRQTGVITLPLLGEQRVAGLTTDELARQLAKTLEAYVKDANVSVILVPAPMVIHVMGEIGGGGKKEFKKPISMLELMAESGALSQFADKKGIFVLRQGQRIRFEYKHILRGAPHVRHFYLEDGDVVVVE